MKFTIALLDLENLVKAACIAPSRKVDNLMLTAHGSRVFIERKGTVAGMDALVSAEGSVTLPTKPFRNVLKTYKGTRRLDFEGNADGLRIQKFRMPVVSYDSKPKLPADFHVLQPLKTAQP
jgi:hypothetical protein